MPLPRVVRPAPPRALAASSRTGLKLAVARLAPVAVLVAVVMLVAASPVSAQPACTITWDGGDAGSWHDDANWDTNVVPGSSDHVCIPTGVTVGFSVGTVSVLTVQSQGTLAISGGELNLTHPDPTEPSVTAGLSQSGGTVGGAGVLSVSGSFGWSGGSQTGAGQTTIAVGASATIDAGAFGVFLSGGRTVRNDGSVVWVAGTISGGEDALIDNVGSFEARGDDVIQHNVFVAGTLTFHNSGSFTKSGGTGTTGIASFIDNDGTLGATSGTLSLLGGDNGASATGEFAAAAGATLDFNTGVYNLVAGASISGAGTVVVSNAGLSIGGAVPAVNLSQLGGTVGGAGVLSVSGSFGWGGGSQTGAGQTRIAAGASATIDARARAFF